MSQLNVRDLLPGGLEGGRPLSTASRPNVNAPRVPTSGESLIAPGTTPLPVTSRGAQLAEQASRVLSGIGAVAQDAGQLANQSRAEQRRLDAEVKQTRAEARYEQRVAAQEQRAKEVAVGNIGREDLAIADGQIASGDIRMADGSNPEKSAKQLTQKVIEENPDWSEGEAAAYRKATEPGYIRLFNRQKVRETKVANATLIANELASVNGAGSEDMRKAAEAINFTEPSVSIENARDMIAVSAMDYALAQARTNPKDARPAFDEAVKFADKRIGTKVASAQAEFAALEKQSAEKISADSRQKLFGFINDGQPAALVIAEGERMRQSGLIDESVFHTIKGELLAEERKVVHASDVRNARETTAVEDANLMMNKQAWAIVGSKKLVLSDGVTPLTIESHDRMEAAAAQVLSAAASTYPSDPVKRANFAIKTFSDSDYLPDQWHQLLTVGAAQATSWNVDSKSAVPNATKASLELYKSLRAAESPLVNKIPENERAVLEGIRQAQNAGSGDDIGAAVTQYRENLLHPRPAFNATDAAKVLREQDLITHSRPEWRYGVLTIKSATIKNEDELISRTIQRAESYRGVNGQAALEEAAKDMKQSLVFAHGWGVDVASAHLPSQLRDRYQDVSDSFASDWLKANPKTAVSYRVTGDNTVLAFNDTSGTWGLLNADNGRALPNQNPMRLEDLVNRLNTKIDSEIAADKAKTLARQQEMQSLQMSPLMYNLTNWLKPDKGGGSNWGGAFTK